ncbi:TRAP transporter small permease subunit [Paracoccus xiamenensis]|uniref:TRAP transporter small permease subunit n=1 Tax=Paracoccus xiamenensis TaxID=2714901 RepID=UPI00140B98C0|nr:TRAP transporter small permease [Paracoccus xiamenensis]NHF74448.1 TRAP transporter small permease [Paracoccus xiamenensis]
MVRIVAMLTIAMAWIAGLAVALMMFHVVADVVGKYFFSAPIPSTAEIVANYYMIATVFLSLAYIEAKNSAISVELIYEMVGPRFQAFMVKLGQVVTLIFYAGLGWFSWDMAKRAFDVNETVDGIWRVVIWPAKFMLPLGLGIACLVLLIRIFSRDDVKLADDGPDALID